MEELADKIRREKVNLSLDPTVHKALKRQAFEKEVQMGSIVEEALKPVLFGDQNGEGNKGSSGEVGRGSGSGIPGAALRHDREGTEKPAQPQGTERKRERKTSDL